MEDLKDRLKSLFEANKEQEALFTTVDEQVFFNEADAHNHAQRTGEAYTKHSRNGNALAADAGEIELLKVALNEEQSLHEQTKNLLKESEDKNNELSAELEALKVTNTSKK